MKHYPHHIGDFDKATRHLTRIERSVYRDMIDLYYDTEQRLTLDFDSLCRKIIARSNEESTAVQQVLNSVSTERQLTSNHKPVTNNQEREPTPDGDSGKKPVSPKASRIAPDWQPDEVLMAWAKAERSDLHLATTVASFRDYWIGKSGKDATKTDWSATFRNWVRREKGNSTPQAKTADSWAGRDF